jgi:hypothetical protein
MDLVALGVGLVLLCTTGLAIRAGTLRARRRPLPRRLQMALWAGAVICLLLIDMILVEPRWIEVERVTIRDSRLADLLGATKVVQISDLHVPERLGVREESLIRVVNGLQPDIVVITGDFVSDTDGKATAIEVTRRITAKLGKFGVPGNNDTHRYKPGEMRKVFPAAEVVVLVNEHRRIPLPNGRVLYMAGVNHPVTGQALIDEALAGIPAEESVVMLAHSPEFLPVAAQKGVDLLLTGHTHGGQVGMQWFTRNFMATDPINTMHGLYRERQTTMYVNRGIGTTTVPFRFLCRPEVTLFEFVD